MTTKQTEWRAVYLSVLVLLSVFSGVVAFSGTSAAASNTLVVDASGTDGSYTSIQNAVTDANTGDTIEVRAGSYKEDVTVSAGNVELLGPNAGTPGSTGRGDEATIEGQVAIEGEGVTIDGFEVSPPPAYTDQGGEAVRVSGGSDGVTVKNNIVIGFDQGSVPENEGFDGIVAFGGTADDPVENIEISDNNVQKIGNDDSGAAGISIQGNVKNADVTNNVVSNVGLEDTPSAFGIVIRGTTDHGIVPEDVSVTNNEITDVLSDPGSCCYGVGFGVESDGTGYDFSGNSIDTADLGIEIKTAAAETTIDSNTITGSDAQLLDATNNVDLTDIRDTNTLEGGVVLVGDHSGSTYTQGIYTTVQAGIDNTASGGTITVSAGTYEESIQIENDVTLTGQGTDSTELVGRVAIQADGVTVRDLAISEGGVASGSDEIDAIVIGDSTGFSDSNSQRITIVNVEIRDIVAPDSNTKPVDAIHINSYDSGDPITGVDITNAEITNVAQSDARANGVKVQADVNDVDITGTRIADITGKRAYGVVATPSSEESGVPGEVTISGATLTGVTATAQSGVGLGIDGNSDDGYAAPSEVDVSYTEFTNNDVDILNKDTGSGNVQATLNWYGDADATSATIEGAVRYNPYLTASPGNVDRQATQQFAYDLTIPRDGNVHSISFPGPVQGTVSDLISLKQGETIYAYDAAADSWLSGSEVADSEIGSLDAFLISTTDATNPIRVTVAYENTNGVSQLSGATVKPGWNFVGASQNGPAKTAFGSTTGEIGEIVHLYSGPSDSPGSYASPTLAVGPTDDSSALSPHTGYWVYMNEGGEIASVVPTGATASDTGSLLKWSDWP
jgi:hypothetical protein